MQRDIFLEFLSTLEENCQKFFVGSKTDYRRLIPTNNVDQVCWKLSRCSYFVGHFTAMFLLVCEVGLFAVRIMFDEEPFVAV